MVGLVDLPCQDFATRLMAHADVKDAAETTAC